MNRLQVEQLKHAIGAYQYGLLREEASKFFNWMRTQPVFRSNPYLWLKNEGGPNNIIGRLMLEAFMHEDWGKGFKVIYNDIAAEYRTDAQRNRAISLDHLLETGSGLLDTGWEPGAEILEPLGVLALSDYIQLHAGADKHQIFLAWYGQLPELKREVIETWVEVRSYKTTAQILDLDVKYVKHAISHAYKTAGRL